MIDRWPTRMPSTSVIAFHLPVGNTPIVIPSSRASGCLPATPAGGASCCCAIAELPPNSAARKTNPKQAVGTARLTRRISESTLVLVPAGVRLIPEDAGHIDAVVGSVLVVG